MTLARLALISAAALQASACAWLPAGDLALKESLGGYASDVTSEVARSERESRERSTLSSLAAIYDRVADYVRHEGKAPASLEVLVPRYLPDIAPADAAIRGHTMSSQVTNYPATVIRDGAVDGTQLKDTGHWGYAYNDRQAVVFVDCTHVNSRNRPWYRER